MGVPTISVWHDRGEAARESAYVRSAIRAPNPDEDQHGYMDLLRDLSEDFGGGLLVPTSDSTVEVVARHKPELATRYKVACVEWEIAERFLDKRRTYALAREVGVPTPPTFHFDSIDELEAARDQLTLPSVVKPCHSHLYFGRFGSKMALVDTFDELVRAWARARRAGLQTLVQEFIPGADALGTNYNAYVWEGRAVAQCTARKLRLSPPRIGFPRAVVSEEIPELGELGRRLINGMGHYGFANVEFKRDPRDGVYKLMEMNGRHNLSTLLSQRAGVNFPWLMYRHLMEGELPRRPPVQVSGVFWIALPTDAVQSLKRRDGERLSLREFLLPYVRPHVFDRWDRRDPKPFLNQVRDVLRATAQRIAARLMSRLSGSPA
jgi:D-aspartate ligase